MRLSPSLRRELEAHSRGSGDLAVRAQALLIKYSDDQPRDADGRFAGGSATSSNYGTDPRRTGLDHIATNMANRGLMTHPDDVQAGAQAAAQVLRESGNAGAHFAAVQHTGATGVGLGNEAKGNSLDALARNPATVGQAIAITRGDGVQGNRATSNGPLGARPEVADLAVRVVGTYLQQQTGKGIDLPNADVPLSQ